MGNLNYQSGDETLGGYEPIPVDTYTVTIIDSEVKQTASGQGTGINLKFEVMGGDYAGRTLYEWINYQHTNETAQAIGQKTLNTIMQACGMAPGETLNDTSQLHGIAMLADVVIKPDNNGVPQNKIRNYASVDEAGSQPAAQQQATQNASSGSSGTTPAWKR